MAPHCRGIQCWDMKTPAHMCTYKHVQTHMSTHRLLPCTPQAAERQLVPQVTARAPPNSISGLLSGQVQP